MNDFKLVRIKEVLAVLLMVSASFVLTAGFSEHCYASGFNGEESNVGSIIQTLALGGGAVGLAWSGLEFAYGDEQKSAKAKSRMIIILVATAAVFALPAVIRTAQSLFQSDAWSPDHLTTK
jgi:hypothetical protein